MSKARLAGLVGALVAYAGGSAAWATTTIDASMPAPASAPGATAEPGPFDLDLASIRRAEENPSAKSRGSAALADVAQSDASNSDPVIASRDVQTIGRPSPTSWLLLVIGVGMIGGALRGFIVANRALARLQPEERE